MDDSNISEKLQALAAGKNRSATERLREKFDEVEVALRARARRKDVFQALVEDGFEFTFKSFELAIYRIRKERGELQKSKNHAPPPPPSPGASGMPANPLHALRGMPKEGDHNPIPTAQFELDKS